MSVQNNLKEIRMQEHMMNITQFAEYIGVDNKILSSWEKNKSRPTLERALEVSKKLNKNVNEIWYLE
ncbi:helix-turn-helix transcriptional regulator [Clostridium botulinum]|uniref:helix-turn-helix transcriptional regulator n=1 Tax=Clostridium botulinum TaxID=1491 RepID=UPI00249DF378|nr:helix-turn-helix transcriptional regulator [Clostridium botulinum]MDU4596420.1 helix-turn-helix transcriptional regulator [Clostridium sporogenes]WGZ48059.1 helix-turn-helix transcriptional regulator [Clostridium botulinum]